MRGGECRSSARAAVLLIGCSREREARITYRSAPRLPLPRGALSHARRPNIVRRWIREVMRVLGALRAQIECARKLYVVKGWCGNKGRPLRQNGAWAEPFGGQLSSA